MSHIQYKFSSSKDYSTTIFDGLSISVIDLKQEILREQKLDPEEFSLVITNEQTNEDYGSDQTLIPKNTSVVVRRVPYTGPKMSRMANGGHSQQSNAGYVAPPFGSGGGSSYQRGQMAQSTAPVNQYGYRGPQGGGVNGQHRGNASNQRSEDNARNGHEVPSSVEDAGIAAMFEQSNEQWMHQQSLMEMQRPMYQPRPGGPRPRPAMMRPEHQGPPPPNYICHRCGKPGHWIYSCPSLSQPGDGSGKPTGFRVKRTTGIPKSFLQKVDNIEDVGNALVTSDGTLVVATANEAAWNMAQKMSRNAVSTEDEIDPNIIPNSIKCNICHKISRDAVTTPCCKTVFCSTCIECELLEPGDMNFTCPACHTKDVVPDQLETAGEVRSQVEEFLREYSAKQHAALEESDRAARKAAAAASAPAVAASAVGGANGVPASAPSAAATSASTSIARPPAQVPPRPRQQHMGGMLPGMLMGLGGGYPGMAGMPMGMQMGMGQMPPFMPPGMMMPPGIMPPAGMMPSRPPPLPGMAAAGQWDGGSAALPMGGAMAGWPAAVGPQHQTRPIGGPQTSQAPSPSPSRPRSRIIVRLVATAAVAAPAAEGRQGHRMEPNPNIDNPQLKIETARSRMPASQLNMKRLHWPVTLALVLARIDGVPEPTADLETTAGLGEIGDGLTTKAAVGAMAAATGIAAESVIASIDVTETRIAKAGEGIRGAVLTAGVAGGAEAQRGRAARRVIAAAAAATGPARRTAHREVDMCRFAVSHLF
ncbi:Retinoblastoma-binding protein [Coemansia thaxteri]|nr:Retinoblastoma-binding protein [Coemansia thaxteri]